MPTLKNPEVEQLAQNIARVFFNAERHADIFNSYAASHPDLKRWEMTAISSRAREIVDTSPGRVSVSLDRQAFEWLVDNAPDEILSECGEWVTGGNCMKCFKVQTRYARRLQLSLPLNLHAQLVFAVTLP